MSVSSISGASAVYASSHLSASRTTGSGTPGESAGAAMPTGASDATALSEEDRRIVAELAQRDREVRGHEQAHMAAGAGLVVRGATYSFQTGPDGQRYAVGGEVGISVAPGRTPQDTLDKAERIRAAALAPAEPSGTDRQVAAQASRMAMEARMEIVAQRVGGPAGGADAAYRNAAVQEHDPAQGKSTGTQVDTYA